MTSDQRLGEPNNTKGRAGRLRQELLGRRWLTPEELRRAVAHQKSRGGALDTCILELELIDERRLLALLSDIHGVPGVDRDQIQGIRGPILELLPAKMAVKLRALPFRLQGEDLAVAMREPQDLPVLDQLAFATRLHIVPHVALEVRICEGLARHFDQLVDERFFRLWDRLNRKRFLWSELVEEPEEEPADLLPAPWRFAPSPPVPPRDSDGGGSGEIVPLSAPAPDIGPTDDRDPPEPQLADWSPKPPPELEVPLPKAPTPAEFPPSDSLEELARLLSGADTKHDVGRLLLGFLTTGLARAILFRVEDEQLHGWLGTGSGIDPERLRTFRLDLGQPSLLQDLLRGASYYRGSLPAIRIHRQLADLWGGIFPAECLLLPIRIGDRVTAIVYADRDPHVRQGHDLEAVREAVALAGEVLAELS